MNTVETEGAIHVADFCRLKQGKLTPALQYGQAVGGISPASDTVVGLAIGADGVITYFNFEWGQGGSEKVELPDGAYELTEGRVLEEAIDYKYCCEVAKYEPRRPPWRGPQAECLI
ncbi:MAG TPA: hypothetical protein VGD64_09635 [Acidisarcina sp.]